MRGFVWRILIFLLLLAAGLLLPASAVAAETSAVTVTVPDYAVSTAGGIDQVSLPGGQLLLEEEGRSQVPYWLWTRTYPAGQHVRDVRLVGRSDVQTARGYALPPVQLTADPKVPAGLTPGWYPAQPLKWSIRRNNDGSSLLIVHIFPLFYHSESKTIEFYRQHHLEISVVDAQASLLSVSCNHRIFAPGDPVVLDIRLQNKGDRQDFYLNILIRDSCSGDIMDGLPVMRLADLSGEALCTAAWQTKAIPEGDYQFEVTLTETGGAALDFCITTVLLRAADELPTTSPSPSPSPEPAAPAESGPGAAGKLIGWPLAGLIGGVSVLLAAAGFAAHWLVKRRRS